MPQYGSEIWFTGLDEWDRVDTKRDAERVLDRASRAMRDMSLVGGIGRNR